MGRDGVLAGGIVRFWYWGSGIGGFLWILSSDDVKGESWWERLWVSGSLCNSRLCRYILELSVSLFGNELVQSG